MAPHEVGAIPTRVPDKTWTESPAMHCFRGFAGDPGGVIRGHQGASTRLAQSRPGAARPEPNPAVAGFGKSDGDGRDADSELAEHSPSPHGTGGA